jgi:hypothetical protein
MVSTFGKLIIDCTLKLFQVNSDYPRYLFISKKEPKTLVLYRLKSSFWRGLFKKG